MKKQYLYVVILTALILMFIPTFAQDEMPFEFDQTYVCGDAYTLSVRKPTTSLVPVKTPVLEYLRDAATGRNTGFQVVVSYGTPGMDENLFRVHLRLRNLGQEPWDGLSKDSFKLTGVVRDRTLEFTPELVMPVEMTVDEWQTPMVRANRPVNDTGTFNPSKLVNYDIHDFWNPYFMEEKVIYPLREEEFYVIFRVPDFLRDWVLYVEPTVVRGYAEAPVGITYQEKDSDSCTLVMRYPTSN